MGYETGIIVVNRACISVSNVCLIDKFVHLCYPSPKTPDEYFYYDSFNNARYFNPSEKKIPIIKSYWGERIATINLCNAGMSFPNFTCPFEEGNTHVYCEHDGNTLLGLDFYGKYRKFIPIQIAIESFPKGDDYRRFKIAKNLLKSIHKEFPKQTYSEIGCLFFGY